MAFELAHSIISAPQFQANYSILSAISYASISLLTQVNLIFMFSSLPNPFIFKTSLIITLSEGGYSLVKRFNVKLLLPFTSTKLPQHFHQLLTINITAFSKLFNFALLLVVPWLTWPILIISYYIIYILNILYFVFQMEQR